MARPGTAALAACALAATGCGAAASTPKAPRTLPAGAVSYLPSTARRLTPDLLAREAGAPALRADLGAWGYRAGAQRYFQGESHRLQMVDARALRFARATGAAAYVRFMRSDLRPFLGSFAAVSPLAGDDGFVARGQECQCHLANPSFLALTARGTTVTWLEINGPGATRRVLERLLARALQPTGDGLRGRWR